MKLKVKKLDPRAVLPTRKTEYSAGYDICSLEDVTLVKGEKPKLIRTGISIEPECDVPCAVLLLERSSMGKLGINLSNGIGLIDSDYRGEYCVMMQNTCGEQVVEIKAGDRIAQLLPIEVLRPEVVEVDELSDTQRGTGGFGSTGK